MMIDILLFALVIAVAIYTYRQRKLTNYFFSIFFEWADIYSLLELSAKDVEHLKINPRYHYTSVNGNDPEGLGVDSTSAIFEYFVFPNSTGNGEYRYSTMYDQQLKRFFETPNIIYSQFLSDGKLNNVSIKFGKSIARHNGVKLSGLLVCFSNDDVQKLLLIAFDDKYLNLKNGHNWQNNIPFRVLVSEEKLYGRNDDEAVVKEIVEQKGKIYVSISPQSQDDAQSFHLPSKLYGLLKKTTTTNGYMRGNF